MALNPLKIATDGYLKREEKDLLVISVSGYLNFPIFVTEEGRPPRRLEKGDKLTKAQLLDEMEDYELIEIVKAAIEIVL